MVLAVRLHCPLPLLARMSTLLLFLLLLLPSVSSSPLVPHEETEALQVLFEEKDGENWLWYREDLFGPRWNFTKDPISGDLVHNPCSTNESYWQGIGCSGSPGDCSHQNCSIVRIDVTFFGLEGTIPKSLQNFSNLEWLSLGSNELTGSIPHFISQLTTLRVFDVTFNQLNGTIPHVLGNIHNLRRLYINHNYFTGTLPGFLAILPELRWIDLSSNFFTGPVSDILSRPMPTIERLYFGNNLLSGTIPHSVSNLTSLLLLDIRKNSIHGSIPESFSTLTDLEYMSFELNQMSGTLPQGVENLIGLDWLDVSNNGMSGTLPPGTGYLPKLEWFDLAYNVFTGYIPTTFGYLKAAQHIALGFNLLSSTLPQSLGNLDALTELSVQGNKLSGPIPSDLGFMSSLQRLFLGSNQLTMMIPTSFSNLTELILLDLGNNQLSGDIPSEMGSLGVVTMSLSVNCLSSKIPDSFCNMRTLEVLSLNGLGGGDNCKNSLKIPLFGTTMTNNVQDSEIPSCLWTLPRLATLHLTGNGLLGSISEGISATRVADVSLSHNRLDGTLPIPSRHINQLDVSYNSITGLVELGDEDSNHTLLKAQVNLLSGQLPVESLEQLDTVDVLRGNMFSCDTVPGNDPNRFGYDCGSALYDYSMYLFAAVMTLALALGVYAKNHYMSEWSADLMEKTRQQATQALMICQDFYNHGRFFSWLFIVFAAGSLPIYVLRLVDSDHSYSTHWNVYSWVLSVAYIKGNVMGVLFICTWACMVLSVAIFAMFYKRKEPIQSNEMSQNNDNKDSLRNVTKYSKVAIVYFGNVILTMGANILYVYCVSELSLSPFASFTVRICMSLYRIISTVTVLPFLSQQVLDPVHRTVFRFRLQLFNNMLIPCVVTALTSPNCFQELLVQPDPISTPFSYRDCTLWFKTSDETFCIDYNTVYGDTAEFIPPFSYNNQCTSELLNAYIPVLIIGFSLQLLLPIFLILIVVDRVDFSSLHPVLRKSVHGMLWPRHWHATEAPPAPSELLRFPGIACCDMLNPLAVLLTFGLCSPALAFAVTVFGIAKLRLWTFAVHRFGVYNLDNGGRPDGETHSRQKQCLEAFSRASLPMYDIVRGSFPYVVAYSTGFVIILYSDMSLSFSWIVPFTIIVFSGIVVLVVHKYPNLRQPLEGEVELKETVLNPLPVKT